MKISLILAKSKNNVIGLNNTLPWKLKDDLKNFKELTIGHHVLMGRKTYESLGKQLPNRINMVLSKNEIKVVKSFDSLEKALIFAKENDETELFVIGGANIYEQTIDIADIIYLTEVNCDIYGDAFFDFDMSEWVTLETKEFHKNEKNEYDFIIKKLIRDENPIFI